MTLESMVRSASAAQRDVLRSRIVLLAAEGQRNDQIQEALGVSKPVVIKWRRRFALDRLPGLVDEPGRGRKRKYDAALRHRIAATACTTPPESVGTHWSVRTLARHLGVGVAVVRSVLSSESLQPHRFRYWKDSPDPEFVPKMLAVVGLYMQPPENAVVLSVDEKTSIQALDRTQPRLPLKPHRIERLSHEYKRHGTASLLASLEVHSGQVRAESIRRNNSVTFIRFLRRLLNAYPTQELYIVADNGSSHRSKKTLAWVAKQNRLHLTFTPTHASWLNQIEICFDILTRKVVRRGIFTSRQELVERLMSFIHAYNKEARPFQWTYTGSPLAA
ncbi:MAG TPA: IS630 family transposase [Terriglobia bacterium]|nr:IS630 family transposase [Terriglobia bacterium]